VANARCHWNLIWGCRDKKRAEQNRALRSGPRPDLAAGQVQHAVKENEPLDQHGDVSPHPSDPAAGTKTAKSKKKRKKNHGNGGKGSEMNNSYELDILGVTTADSLA
jgi:hypothetical protein